MFLVFKHPLTLCKIFNLVLNSILSCAQILIDRSLAQVIRDDENKDDIIFLKCSVK